MSKHRKRGRLRLNVYRGRPGATLNVPVGELLLEYFDDNQLLAWRASGSAIQDYHYLWFFELERQRASKQSEILEALSLVPEISVQLSGWGRALAYKHSAAPLSCVGSLRWVGGRFNYGVDIDSSRFAPFPALYLAEDAETALREMHGLQRETTRGGLSGLELSLLSRSGVAWVRVDGHVHNIFDLTSTANLRGFTAVLSKFRLSRAVRMAEDRMGAVPLRLLQTPDELFQSFMIEGWREFPVQVSTPANSQLFAHFLMQAGFEGVLYSSTITGKRNIALFTRQFKNSASIVNVLDPPAGATCCELSAKTFMQLEIVG
jgi:hypothetical protein